MRWAGSAIFNITATIKTQLSDVSCLELTPILKSNFPTPTVHALYPQVFSGKGNAHFPFCFSHYLERIESIDQSKGCKINHIVYDSSTSRGSRLLTDCEPDDSKLRRIGARFSSQNQFHSAKPFRDDARPTLIDSAAQRELQLRAVGEGYPGRSRCGSVRITRTLKNESLKLRKRSSRSWITIYANTFFLEIQMPLAANILKVDRERRLGKLKELIALWERGT